MAKQTALTEKAVERLAKAAAGKRYEKYDRIQPGLALRVTDKGVKSWSCYYRYNGRHQRLTLGRWPTTPVDEARTEARRVRELADSGIDPKAQRERERLQAQQQAAEQDAALRTFGDLAEQYIAREVPRLKRGREIESVIRRQLLPEWENRALEGLRKRDAVRLTDRLIDEGRTAAALKLHEVVKRVFSWAAQRDEIDVSPFADLAPPARKEPRQHALNHGELRTLWAACEREGYPWGDLLKLLLLTGARRGEAANATWAEFDDPDAPTEWVIPAARAKSKRDHLVPLSAPARELLADLPRFVDGDFIFTTTGGRRPVAGFSKAKERVDNTAAAVAVDTAPEQGMVGLRPWRWHDLRRTVRSELPRLGVSKDVAERVLGHTQDPLTATYDVYGYRAEKADALERWGAELMRVVEGGPGGANVVPLNAPHGIHSS